MCFACPLTQSWSISSFSTLFSSRLDWVAAVLCVCLWSTHFFIAFLFVLFLPYRPFVGHLVLFFDLLEQIFPKQILAHDAEFINNFHGFFFTYFRYISRLLIFDIFIASIFDVFISLDLRGVDLQLSVPLLVPSFRTLWSSSSWTISWRCGVSVSY